MRREKSRLCLYCGMAVEADHRNAHHQQYCSAPACRKASKAASQRRWLAKPENLEYHSGPAAVARVRDWQIANPQYFERQRAGRSLALQDLCVTQVIDTTKETAKQEEVSDPALQDFMRMQPIVLIGLIAHLFNFTLQDDIANTARILQELGQDVTNGRVRDGLVKESDLFRPRASGASAVQLGRSPPGA